MGGYDKAKAQADKIKAETVAEEEKKAENMQIVKSSLSALQENNDLAKMYQANAKAGADNLAGELPILKVHSVGKSSKNELVDGSEPEDGYFFYKPTQEQFKELSCHILTVSKGFRAAGIEGDKEIFNQMVGGVFIDETGDFKPFVMYLTGLKLSYMWEFGKEASRYTRAKPVGIPMFALTVRLWTEKIVNSFGKSWIIHFSIERNEDTSPKLVLDPGRFQFLADNVGLIEDTISQVIQSKTNKKDNGEVITEREPF